MMVMVGVHHHLEEHSSCHCSPEVWGSRVFWSISNALLYHTVV